MDEYVIYRTGFPSKTLEYIKGSDWDKYVRDTPDTKCEFISRGLTISEAINLTMLANEGVEKDDHEI